MISEQEARDYIKSSPKPLQELINTLQKQVDNYNFNDAAEIVQQIHSNIIGLIIAEEFLSK